MADKKRNKKEREGQEPNEDGFGLDMNFEEALERFLAIKPDELKEADAPKKKRPKRAKRG